MGAEDRGWPGGRKAPRTALSGPEAVVGLHRPVLVCFGAVLRTGCGGSEQKPGGSAGAGMEWEWTREALESQDVLTDGR